MKRVRIAYLLLLIVLDLSVYGNIVRSQDQHRLSESIDPPIKTYTAPPRPIKKNIIPEHALPLVYAYGEEIQPPMSGIPRFEISELKPGNSMHMAPGFYASFRPKENDTLFLFDSISEHFEQVQIHATKEVIQGDSSSVMTEVYERIQDYDSQGNLVRSPKRGKTNSMVIRSGFIPAQGFGSKRFRMAVIPGNFKLGQNSMISASVHMLKDHEMGNVLCAVTKIDYQKNMFFVETSNEVPVGENINWIIINTP